MEQPNDVVDVISSLLDNGKYKEALNVPYDEKFAQSFKDNCWDLITVILSKIQDDTIIIKPSLHGACEQLLNIIIEKATPEEALLEFIEQVEIAKNDAQFSIILIPLQQLLKKLTLKRGRSLEWSLNSITTYIEGIPNPQHHLEGKERLLMDCDDNIRRIIKVYSLIPSFYKPFIEELNSEKDNVRTKQILCAFLISILGKQLIHIDLDPDTNAQSEARQTCSIIIDDICILEKNLLKFLTYVELCCIKANKSSKPVDTDNDSNEVVSPYEHTEKINMTSLSGLFYVIFSKHFKIKDIAIPQVYCNTYIVHTIFLNVNHLLSFMEFGPISKALCLCKALLNLFPNNASNLLLKFPVHFDLLKGLVKVAIYSSFIELRKNAVHLIGLHVNKFDYKGRTMLIKFILEFANHSGMIGYAITLYKNTIDEAFKDDFIDDVFTGAHLTNMIKKICLLPHGAESDLVELADQVITALNFLRYLVLKDTSNKTGIQDNLLYIEKKYLAELRMGLNMSKAHYEVKLKDIMEDKTKSSENIDVSINIGGNVLDNIPVENKKEIINSALNAFHLIEGLVARLSECISITQIPNEDKQG